MINNALTKAFQDIIRSWIIAGQFPSFWDLLLYWSWPFMFGFIWGKLVARFLARVPPDVIVEILTTLVASYTVFYIVEEFVGKFKKTS